MPDIILPGSAGRIEARYQRQKAAGAPMALVLHPHPQFGGTMNNPLVYDLFHMFHDLGCTTVRFNFRGVGRSQGSFDNGSGELSDAAAVLDWMNTLYPNPSHVWVCGISFGAWIGMQLLMRRPEIDGFICVAPPSNLYDFSFLAPCPSSGLILNGDKDRVVPTASVVGAAWDDVAAGALAKAVQATANVLATTVAPVRYRRRMLQALTKKLADELWSSARD